MLKRKLRFSQFDVGVSRFIMMIINRIPHPMLRSVMFGLMMLGLEASSPMLLDAFVSGIVTRLGINSSGMCPGGE